MKNTVLWVVMACGALVPTLALADAREDVIAGVTRCAVLTDDRQWLDCYYGAAQPMRADLGLAPAPQAQIKLLQNQPKAGAAALPTTVTRAAVRTGPPPPPKTASMLDFWGGDDIVNNAPLKAYDMSANGFTVTLQDGQVWQQTPDDATKRPVSWREPASSIRVTISQAAMHTFNLVVGDENTHHKVKRIK
jgi:hypothetical protein